MLQLKKTVHSCLVHTTRGVNPVSLKVKISFYIPVLLHHILSGMICCLFCIADQLLLLVIWKHFCLKLELLDNGKGRETKSFGKFLCRQIFWP